MFFLKKNLDALPRVAIGIPLYNEEQNILQTLISIKNQTYQNFVCFINDDLSSDNSYFNVKAFISEDERFILYRQPSNAGGWKNFATVLNFLGYVANCDYSFDIGHHDLISPNYLEETISFLESHKDYSSCTGKIYSFETSTATAIERPGAYYEFFKTSGLEAFLSSANLLNDCTIYNSVFRTKNLFFIDPPSFLASPTRSADHLVISTLAYSGKIKILDSAKYYRKVFTSVDTRPSISQRQSTEISWDILNSNFLCGYLDLFHKIFATRLSCNEYEKYRAVLFKDLLKRFNF